MIIGGGHTGLMRVAGVGAMIQSIQPFSITIATGATSNTATITSVDATKSVIIWGGSTSTDSGGSIGNINEARVTLTNGTTVTATRNTSSASFTVTVKGTVVEFKSAKIQSVQYGTIVIADSTTSNTATISSITTTNAAVLLLGQSSDSASGSLQRHNARLTITDATTVTATKGNNSDNLTVSFVVVEFASGVLNSSTQQASIALATTTVENTATISSINTATTMLFYGGVTSNRTAPNEMFARATLTNATTITANKDAGVTLGTVTINVTAVEFKTADIVSIQRGTITISGAASNTATINSVNTTKAVANYLGMSTSNTTTEADLFKSSTVLTNGTTVTAAAGASVTANVVGYSVIEFL